MNNLDQIRYAVVNNEDRAGDVVAFFGAEEDACAFISAMEERPEGDYVLLDREDDEFYIDVRADISSSFDIRG